MFLISQWGDPQNKITVCSKATKVFFDKGKGCKNLKEET
jgi:hypothetical protein